MGGANETQEMKNQVRNYEAQVSEHGLQERWKTVTIESKGEKRGTGGMKWELRHEQ
jgi:hypothetical protein